MLDPVLLMNLLANDPDPDVRMTAAAALGRVGDAQAVPALCAALRDASPGVQNAAAEALGEIGDPAAIPCLVGVLGLPGDQGLGDAIRVALHSLPAAPVVAALLPRLMDPDPTVRRAAAQDLGYRGYGAAVPALRTAATGDPDEEVRWRAVRSLGSIGDPASVPDLRAVLRDLRQAPRLRQMAAVCFGNIGDKAALPDLYAALQDPDGGVRKSALDSVVLFELP